MTEVGVEEFHARDGAGNDVDVVDAITPGVISDVLSGAACKQCQWYAGTTDRRFIHCVRSAAAGVTRAARAAG